MHALLRRTASSVLKRKAHVRWSSTSNTRGMNEKYFKISEEVQDAVKAKKPVVALETTIYTHGTSLFLSETSVVNYVKDGHIRII